MSSLEITHVFLHCIYCRGRVAADETMQMSKSQGRRAFKPSTLWVHGSLFGLGIKVPTELSVKEQAYASFRSITSIQNLLGYSVKGKKASKFNIITNTFML